MASVALDFGEWPPERWNVGQACDALDNHGYWYEATVLKVSHGRFDHFHAPLYSIIVIRHTKTNMGRHGLNYSLMPAASQG
jgi:hypothetical protein